jgi:hypothetical protein
MGVAGEWSGYRTGTLDAIIEVFYPCKRAHVWPFGIKGTNPSHHGKASWERRAVVRFVLGLAGAGSVGTPVARGGSATGFVCSGALLVLVTPASRSISSREGSVSTTRWKPWGGFNRRCESGGGRIRTSTGVSPSPSWAASGNRNQLAKPLRAEDGLRTHDPHPGRVMLYQLSYFRLLSPIEHTCDRGRVCRCRRAYLRRTHSARPIPIGPGLCDFRER